MEVTLEGDYFDGFFQMWSIGLKNDKHNFSIFLSLEQRNTSKEYEDEFEHIPILLYHHISLVHI